MSRIPMPSPNNTNHERLYMAGPTVAYDEEPDGEQDYAALISFLEQKLNDGDMMKVKRMLGLDDDAGSSGASDASFRAAYRASHPEFQHYHAQAREMHRLGVIDSAELGKRLKATEVPRLSAVGSAKSSFPHANRLKI